MVRATARSLALRRTMLAGPLGVLKLHPLRKPTFQAIDLRARKKLAQSRGRHGCRRECLLPCLIQGGQFASAQARQGAQEAADRPDSVHAVPSWNQILGFLKVPKRRIFGRRAEG